MFADMNDFLRLCLAVALGHVLVLATGTFVALHRCRVGLCSSLGRLFDNGHPAILALGAGHDDHVARLDILGVANRLDRFELNQFGGAFLLSERARWQPGQTGNCQGKAAADQTFA